MTIMTLFTRKPVSPSAISHTLPHLQMSSWLLCELHLGHRSATSLRRHPSERVRLHGYPPLGHRWDYIGKDQAYSSTIPTHCLPYRTPQNTLPLSPKCQTGVVLRIPDSIKLHRNGCQKLPQGHTLPSVPCAAFSHSASVGNLPPSHRQ